MTRMGPVEIDVDGDGVVVCATDPVRRERWGAFGLHVDHRRSRCVTLFGAPPRVYAHLGPLGVAVFGLPERGESHRWELTAAQVWSRRTGWRNADMGVAVFYPHRRFRCTHRVGSGVEECGAWRYHSGPHSGAALAHAGAASKVEHIPTNKKGGT